MASLIFVEGPEPGREFPLAEDDCIIGRGAGSQVYVPDMHVSRQHARIRKKANAWYLEDLGSNNGTYVNGRRVQSVRLRHQDEIGIARAILRVSLPDEAGPVAHIGDTRVSLVDLNNTQIFVSSVDLDSAPSASPSRSPFEVERELFRLRRKVQAITAILESAANTNEPTALLEAFVAQLLEIFPQADAVSVLVHDERTQQLRLQAQLRRSTDEVYGGELEVPGTLISHVVKGGRGVLLRESGTDLRANLPAAGAKAPRVTGSRMGAPIQARGIRFGLVYVEADRAGVAFRQEDVDLLTTIAGQAGLAIYTARMHQQILLKERLETDLRLARQIQRSLLPSEPPRVPGLLFAVHYEPAFDIGGDFYDFIWLDPGNLAIVIGDVAGKAMSGALYMARLSSELRSLAAYERTPGRLLGRVNRGLASMGEDGMFATLIYAVYDLSRKVLLFANAGHTTPLLRRDGRVFPVEFEAARIAPVGVLPELDVGEAELELAPGDMLVLTTDGILEARDPVGTEYGLEKLATVVANTDGGPRDVVRAILQDVDRHVAAGAQGDDMTIVTMFVGEPARTWSDATPVRFKPGR